MTVVTPERSWLARHGRMVGLFFMTIGFTIFFIETQVPTLGLKIACVATIAGGTLLSLAGDLAETLADEDARSAQEERRRLNIGDPSSWFSPIS